MNSLLRSIKHSCRLPKFFFSFILLLFFSSSILLAQPVKLWDRTFGGSQDENLNLVKQTPDGGYILGGTSLSPAGFDKMQGLSGESDFWIVKLNADGSKAWDRTYGGIGIDNMFSMGLTSDGGYILAGYSTSGISGDKTEATQGYWIVKLSSNGIKTWDKSIGGITHGSIDGGPLISVQQTNDGGYILGSQTTAGIGGFKSEASRGEEDYWIVKLNQNGAKLWDKTYGGSGHDYIHDLLQTSDGGYIATGYSGSPAGADKAESSVGEDAWVIKMDANGAKIWEKTIGGNGSDASYCIDQTADGGFIVGINSTSGTGAYKTEASRGGLDYWVVKLNGNGIKEWDKTVGGSAYDGVFDIKPTLDGGYLLGGDSYSPASGDKSENWKGLYGYGDYWIIKLDQSGAIVWQKTIGGGVDDYLRSMDQLADGSYILGGFGGGIAAYDKSERTRGGRDFWVVKLAAEAPGPVAFTPIRINSGGRSFTTSDGRLFRADSFFTGDDRISTAVGVDILNTTHDELYRTGRCSDNFGYNIPVPNGNYKVTLHFAETYWGVYPGRPAIASRRVFNVNAEGENKLASYKILERAGGPLRAVQETFNVSVSDGFLNLDFLPGGADKPRVSAIEVEAIKPLTLLSLSPVADAYVRQGSSLGNNYGQEQTIDLKATITAELRRFAYLKFSLAGLSEVNSAKLRIYGRNHEGNTTVRVGLAGIDNDSWTETGINGSNAPTGPATALGTFNVMKNEQFFEVDITDFAKAQLAQDKTLTLMLSDLFTTNKRVTFNSRENAVNPPALLITTSGPVVSAARIAQAELSAKPEYEAGSSVVYPNPVQTKFTIQVGSRHQRSINLSLISNAGRVHPIRLPESLDAGTKAEIDISSMHLPTGIYLLKVQSDSASEILKVLLAK